jgi:hypothetical protein
MTDRSYEPPAFTDHFNKVPPDVLYHYTGQGRPISPRCAMRSTTGDEARRHLLACTTARWP